MFYIISKLIAFFLTSLHFLVGLGVIGILLLVTRFQRLAKTLMAASLLLIATVGFLPVGTALTLPLEQRFPPWKDVGVAPAGVIVLGGALNPELSQARQGFALNESAERIVTGILLARKYPDALLVFTGGGDDPTKPRESDISAHLAEQMGVLKNRLIVEDRARSTAENATYTRELVSPKPGQRWLLVTSAMHMPRAVGAFRKAGFPVEAYPVNYTTTGRRSDWTLSGSIGEGLKQTDAALHEWVGLLAYRLSGRTDDLFPAPKHR